VKRGLELRPIAVGSILLLFSYAPRGDSDRDGDDQKPRQMMRPDTNRIEVKRQRQHHHRVVGARCGLRTVDT
jgi:hypothetical protein